MSLSRRFALLLALGLAAVAAAPAQSSTSSSSPDPDQAQAAQPAGESQGQLSVQARIKARREQRRAAAIHEAYAHSYEIYTGMGYLRFRPGPGVPASSAFPPSPALERAHEYAWNVGFTRYFDERLGVTADGRGYYASAYVYNNAVYQQRHHQPGHQPVCRLCAGPTYRFYLQPKFSVCRPRHGRHGQRELLRRPGQLHARPTRPLARRDNLRGQRQPARGVQPDPEVLDCASPRSTSSPASARPRRTASASPSASSTASASSEKQESGTRSRNKGIGSRD